MPSGAYQFATVNPRYFNKFDCDDVFKRIESKAAGALANDINKALEEMQKLQPAAQPAKEVQSTHAQKRPLTPLFTEASSSDQPKSKKQKGASGIETSHVIGIQARCDECQLVSIQ